MAVIIWLAIYPLITFIFMAFGNYLMQIEFLPLRTLILTAIVVPVMVFILLPFLTKLLGAWLKR